jgi:hypothetical protein
MSGDAEVDIEQEPELRPICVVAKVYRTLRIEYKEHVFLWVQQSYSYVT